MDKLAVRVGVLAGVAIISAVGILVRTAKPDSREKKRYREEDDDKDNDDDVDDDDDDDDDHEQQRREKERQRHRRKERKAMERRVNQERERREQERRYREAFQEREREQEEREWWLYQVRERRAHEERIRRANEERDQREREERDRWAYEERKRREQQEKERRANEERERRERQEKERRANEERERRERQEKERRANEERERREREERERIEKARQAQTLNQQEASQGTSSGASQPPQGNRNNNNKNNSKKKITDKEYFDMFMKLFQRLLQTIYGFEKEPISELFGKPILTPGQRKYLIKVVKTLENFDTLEAVLEIVIIIFKDHMSADINFANFLSLLKFVRSYLNDKVNEIQTETDEYTEGTYEERRARILRYLREDNSLVVRIVVLVFRQLAAEIAAECAAPNNLSPDFRDMFAKVYHYYKHRRISNLPDYQKENICVPDKDKPFLPENGILSVEQYFYWARQYLAKLKNKIRSEVENASPPVTYRYEVFVVLFGRRLCIVVKVRADRTLVLSTVFFDDNCYPGDADGFEDLNIQKKKKK